MELSQFYSCALCEIELLKDFEQKNRWNWILLTSITKTDNIFLRRLSLIFSASPCLCGNALYLVVTKISIKGFSFLLD